jgi:hypothetical protein
MSALMSRWKVQACVSWMRPGVLREAKISSEPEALTVWLKGLGYEIVRIDWRRDRSRSGCTAERSRP